MEPRPSLGLIPSLRLHAPGRAAQGMSGLDRHSPHAHVRGGGGAASGCQKVRRFALTATITVLSDISTAPAAGLSNTPIP